MCKACFLALCQRPFLKVAGILGFWYEAGWWHVCCGGRLACVPVQSLFVAKVRWDWRAKTKTKRSSWKRNLFANHCGNESVVAGCTFLTQTKRKVEGGGGYLSRGVCRSRNQCSVNSSLKLAHIEEGFGHVIANLSAISFCFCCTGVFWSIGHKLLAGKTNGRGMLTRRGLRLPAPLPPPSLVLLQSTCTFLCWEVWLCYREEWGKKKFLQTLSKERL